VLRSLLALAFLHGVVSFAGPAPEPAPDARVVVELPSIVWIPSGWFTMGSSDADIEWARSLCRNEREEQGFSTDMCEAGTPDLFADEGPARRVLTSAFGIDRTEVTQRSYARCVAAGACTPPRLSEADPRVAGPELPVAGVTWQEAGNYCAFVRGRLPTEAEWEHAARGDRERRFPWGRLYNAHLANRGDPSGFVSRYAAPVGSYPDGASPYGLLDVAGNVHEWVQDAYVPGSYATAGRIDPQGPPPSGSRIVRGGSWESPAYELRVTNRAWFAEGRALPSIGFRCAYDGPGV